jgi:hypothetical protein
MRKRRGQAYAIAIGVLIIGIIIIASIPSVREFILELARAIFGS